MNNPGGPVSNCVDCQRRVEHNEGEKPLCSDCKIRRLENALSYAHQEIRLLKFFVSTVTTAAEEYVSANRSFQMLYGEGTGEPVGIAKKDGAQ